MAVGERLFTAEVRRIDLPAIQELAVIAKENGLEGPMQVACDAQAILRSPGVPRTQLMRQAAMSRTRYVAAELLVGWYASKPEQHDVPEAAAKEVNVASARIEEAESIQEDVVVESEVITFDTQDAAVVVETPCNEELAQRGSRFSDAAVTKLLSLIAKLYSQQGHTDRVDLSPGSVDDDFLVALVATYGEQTPQRRMTDELLARDTGIVMGYLEGANAVTLAIEYGLNTTYIQHRLERVASVAARALSLAERPANEVSISEQTASPPKPHAHRTTIEPKKPAAKVPVSRPITRHTPTTILPILPSDQNPLYDGRALCAQTDPEVFFPEKGGSTREAKKICTGCEIRAECLAYALNHDERFGIWGGLSERERRRLKRAAG